MHRHFFKGREARGRHPFGGMRGLHAHGHRRGGRVGRFLDHGDLRFVVLALLEEQPRHGYEIIRELETRTGGAYRPSPGVVYPTLSLLEDEGFARVGEAEGGRKLYQITVEGRQALDKERPAVNAVFGRMAEAAEQSRQSGPRIRRAMENLATALRLRMAGEELSEAQVDAVAKAIDDAAAAIERV